MLIGLYKFLIIMIRTTSFFALSTFICLCADAVDVPRDTLHLEELTVTSQLEPRLQPFDVTTITTQQIEQSAETSLLPIISAAMPGVFVSERGFVGYGVSAGSAGAINIRGVGQANKVLFLIDGQPQWAGVFGHSVADTYGVTGVAAVEVVRGPSSLLYGSNAMGGSVNIITQRAHHDGYYGSARAMIGSFSTQKFDLTSHVRDGKINASLSAQIAHSNGNRANSEYWGANEFAQFGYELSSAWQVGANIYLTQSTADYPGTTHKPIEGMWTNIFRYTLSAYANNKYSFGCGTIRAYINHGNHKIDDGYAANEAPATTIFHATDYNGGVTLTETVHPWQGSDLTLGADWQHWGGHTWRINKSDGKLVDGVDKSEHSFGAYALMQQALHRAISVNAGVRWQYGSQYGNVWVPQAGFTLHPLADSDVRFAFGKGFRAPNIRELYIGTEANSNLCAEYLYSYDVSLTKYLVNRNLRLTLNLFYIDAKEMIQTRIVDGREQYANTGSFVNKGLEVECMCAVSRLWTLNVNYSYLHTTSHALLYAPKNMLNAALTFTPGKFMLTLQSNSVWRLNSGAEKLQDYSLLNLHIAYRHKVMPFVKLDNITNKHYEIIYGCPMPGTTILGGIQVKF